MKFKHLLLTLLFAALMPWTAEAQTKTHIANTASSTQMTWDEFAQNVNNGITYEGETVYLDADITATTMAGTNENNCFKGTFEGQGHTLTFNYTASGSYYTAPFHYLNGATIQNLKVSGTITANYARCGGLAGNCYGTNAIINCLSDITINSTVNGDGTHGGFISRVFRGSTTFEGCTFAGSLIGENTIANGGFVGWSEGNNNYASVSFSNCIYAPVANTTDPSAGATFARGRNNSTTGITISNCFYTSSEFQYTQGKQMHYVSGVNSVVLSMAGEPTHYSVSGITAYSGNQGLNYYGVRAGVGDVVLLNLLGGNTYTISFGGGTLTGDSNPYTLIMPDNDVGIIAESFFPLPFVNDFESGCDMFLYNGGKPDCWCWGTAASHGGTHGLYISNDGGATNNYNNMVEESVYAVKPLHFERGGYDISYDWRSNGGYLRVALAPDWLKFDGVFNINWTNEWVALDGGSSLNNSTEWQTVHQTIEFDAPVDRQLVFIWNNYGVQDINNPPAAIDNVSVMSVSCNKPYDLQCTGFTGTTATLSWTENGDATAWQICLNGDESNLVEANSNPFTLTNLTPEIQYTAKVRANCGDEQSSWSNTISFSPSFKVVIGSGMNPSGELPTDNELDYDLTQQIYTTGELGDAGVFMSIDFFRVSGQFPQASCARNLDIYMTHTDKNVFESNSDWVNVTNADLVFSGTVDFAKDVWTTITLDTPFEYDGQHNVIITVDDNTGSHDDYALFMTFVPYQLQSLGIDSWEITNNFNYDPATYSGSGSLYYGKNHIRVLKLPYGPENLQYSDVTFTTAELSWSGNSESYVVMVSNDNASWDESRTTTSTSYTLTGLYPGTTYQVKVKGVTGDQETAPSHSVYFTTLGTCPSPTNLTVGYVSSTTAELSWSASRYMNSYTVKYKIRGNVFSEGFENGIDDWTIVDGVETFTSASNYAAHTGSYGFRFDSNSSHPQYLVSPELTDITEGMMLEFYYRNWVQGMPETFQVGFSSTDNAIESFTFGDEITVDDAQWHLYSETIPAGTKYICWKYSTTGDWSLFLDDIAVGLDTPWQTITTEGSTTQVSATLTGLMPATTYEAYVYPDCNPDNVTETVYFKTTEDCPRPENLTASYVGATTADLSWTGVPEEESYTMEYREASTVFSEGFENGIGNWTLRNCSGSTGIMTYQGGSAVFLFNNFHNIQYLISPELSGVSDGMKLEFEYYIPVNSTLQETFQIGLSSTDNATESFTFGDTITVTAGQHFTYTELIPAGTKYICWKYTSHLQGLYIDNIVVGLDTPAGAWQTVTVEGNTAEVSATLTDLNPETSYEVHVYPDCDPDKVSATLFFLTQEVCIAPHNLTADKVTATTVKLSWTGEPDLDSYTVEYRTKGDILSEGFENGIGDWTLRNCANNTGIYSSAHSGNNGFVFRNTSNPPQYLISPELEGVTAGKKLEFYYRNANPMYPETFQMGFSSTDNATASFTFGDEITVTDGQWHLYSETIPAGTKHISWKCTSNNQFGLNIDDIAVGMLDWQTVTVAGNAYQVSTTLTGLTPTTPYEAYVYPDCNPELVSETVSFTTTPVPTTVTQTLTLSTGWNWVSLYVEGDPIDLLQSLESALGVNASQISSAELFTENDEGEWWGDLDEEGVTNEQMYMILVETPCTIELEGIPANTADHAITINPGWNWIGFPCDHEMTIEEALGGFNAEEGDVFANSEDFTEFDGEWFGDVAILIPGQGFMYYSNSDTPKTLIIGGGSKRLTR